MNKIISMLLCSLSLGNGCTALFGKEPETPRPVARQLETPSPVAQRIIIPGLPNNMQPTQRQTAGARTPEDVAQLHRDFIAQTPAAFTTNQAYNPNAPMNGSTPRQPRALARQHNLSNSFYTRTRHFVGESRDRRLVRRNAAIDLGEAQSLIRRIVNLSPQDIIDLVFETARQIRRQQNQYND